MGAVVARSAHTKAKRRSKQRRIIASFAGLCIGYLVTIAYHVTGYWQLSLRSWFGLLIATALFHGVYWLVLQLGWDRRFLKWDPQFYLLPGATTLAMLSLTVYLLPDARVLVPYGFLVTLLFLVGLAGFRETVLFSILMWAGYFGAVFAAWRQGVPMSLGYEAMMAGLMLFLGVFAGTVLERVRRRQLEIRRAARQIRKLSRAVEQSASLVLITDTDGIIEYVNPKFTKTTGYTAEEAVGQRPSLLKSDETPAETYEELWTTILSGNEWLGEFKNLKKDGEPFWVITSISPIRNRLGEIVNYIGVQEDITELKQVQAQLVQAQRLEGVGRLVSGVAHDFNNLLTSVLGFAELALDRAPPGSELAEELEQIRKAGRSATSLTQQLLAFSRKQMSRPQILDLNAQLVDTERLLRRTIGEDIELSTELAPDLGRIRADPAQLNQILMNLALNARDAMPSGGRLVLRTANAALDTRYSDEQVAIRPGPYVRLEVSDNGRGMDEATQAQIFEPFFTTKERSHGTGLGLATVYGIVKQNRGYIWVSSEPGSGSTFTVFLPRVDDAEVAAPPGRLAAEAAGVEGAETILVVEDEAAVRLLAERVLTSQGYRVLATESPSRALRLAVEEPIELLITDIVMPGMNGVELARKVIVAVPGIKVLLVSGYAEHAIVDEVLSDPQMPFLRKPFNVGELLRKVREILDGGDAVSG